MVPCLEYMFLSLSFCKQSDSPTATAVETIDMKNAIEKKLVFPFIPTEQTSSSLNIYRGSLLIHNTTGIIHRHSCNQRHVLSPLASKLYFMRREIAWNTDLSFCWGFSLSPLHVLCVAPSQLLFSFFFPCLLHKYYFHVWHEVYKKEQDEEQKWICEEDLSFLDFLSFFRSPFVPLGRGRRKAGRFLTCSSFSLAKNRKSERDSCHE